MRNQFLDSGTAQEIDALVDRVHQDLGNTTEIIQLAAIRELLRLDLHYYTSNDPNLLQEVVHKMRIGAKQVIKRPGLLLEAIAKFDLKALFIPDRKRILLDSKLPELKRRWSESHEILHGLIPWHAEYLLGDTKDTLSPACHQQLESEANYGAGRLIFPHRALVQIARSGGPSIAHVKMIATHFGNTITSALWRYVENSDVPCLGIVGGHPHHATEEDPPVGYFIRSRRFQQEFGGVTEETMLAQVRGYCAYRKAGPLGTAELVLHDGFGVAHVFQAETFSNRYQALTLVSYLRPVPVSIAV